jgi:hypothetical protein
MGLLMERWRNGMKQHKKEQCKAKRKKYSDEELTALGIFTEDEETDEEQPIDSSGN